jgi:hypothetical protein
MKSLLNSFRAAVVALSATGLIAPRGAWAKSPAGGHVTSQARISSSVASTPTTIHSSNGLSSDKISNLSVNSSNSNNSQSGGGHIHNPSVGGSTIGSAVSKISQLKSPWDSATLPVGGGKVKGAAGIRSFNVMDKYSDTQAGLQVGEAATAAAAIATGGASVAVATALGDGLGEGIAALATQGPFQGNGSGKGTDPKHLTNGQDSQYGDGGVMGTYNRNSDGSAGQPVSGTPISMSATFITKAPGSSNLASIANSNAKYYDRNAYIKTSNKNVVSKEIEKKYNDSHPIAQKNKVTGGGSSSNGQSGGSSGGSTTGGSTAGGSTSKKPNKRFPMPFPLPFPGGCDNDGGYAGGDVSPAIYNSDDPAPAPVTTASATASIADTGIDLVLEDVKLAAPATLVAGPAYTVTFRNQGTADAGKFQVGIAAGFNQELKGNDPRAMVEIPSLAAGEVKEVTLRLPHKAVLVEDNGKGLVPFRYLAVAIDATNAVAEIDKTNNMAIVEQAAVEGGTATN